MRRRTPRSTLVPYTTLFRSQTNVNLLGFDNCVFDFEKNILREGRPEDYITLSTNMEMPIKQLELPMEVEELWNKIECRSEEHTSDQSHSDLVCRLLLEKKKIVVLRFSRVFVSPLSVTPFPTLPLTTSRFSSFIYHDSLHL